MSDTWSKHPVDALQEIATYVGIDLDPQYLKEMRDICDDPVEYDPINAEIDEVK